MILAQVLLYVTRLIVSRQKMLILLNISFPLVVTSRKSAFPSPKMYAFAFFVCSSSVYSFPLTPFMTTDAPLPLRTIVMSPLVVTDSIFLTLTISKFPFPLVEEKSTSAASIPPKAPRRRTQL